eukprot:scaffold36766_cov649-Skeletonema_dohrnii-CCMP3373.AAC.3
MEENLEQTFTQHAPALKNFELPALRLVRGKVVFTAVYDVGDASGGKVFGSTVGDGKENISYRMGCGRTLGMRVQTTMQRGNICWGMTWPADGKLRRSSEGAIERYRHGMDLFGCGCGCVVSACLGQLERTPRRGQSKQEWSVYAYSGCNELVANGGSFQRSYRVIQTRNGSCRILMWMCGFGLSRATRKNAETRANQAGVFTQIQDAMNRGGRDAEHVTILSCPFEATRCHAFPWREQGILILESRVTGTIRRRRIASPGIRRMGISYST